MVAQKALQQSVAPWGNYAQRIAMIYPKYHFPILAVLLDSILKIDKIHDLSCDQRLLYE